MPLELPRDYFSLFGLAPTMDVDTEKMRARYHSLQKGVHPDRFAGRGVRERTLAAQVAAHVSEAYRTLSDPYLRASYLLKQQGVETGAEHDTAHDPEFLERQMELHEQMAELDTLQAVDTLSGHIAHEEQELWDCFGREYAREDWDGSLQALHRLLFYRRVRRQLDAERARLG